MSDGYSVTVKPVKLASPADSVCLQRLLERCSDYYELSERRPTPPDAGEHELTSVPEGWAPEDLRVLALQDDSGTLQAMIQLVRNYPKHGTWWIGLMLVAPEMRGQGLGSVLVRHAIEAAAADGATVMLLAVSVENPRAESFWAAEGFIPEGQPRAAAPARSGHVDTVRMMSRAL